MNTLLPNLPIITFQLKDLSTYRSELMAWSIMWIMMLHFTFTQITPLGFIAQYGYAGVDIFMLVSGLGIYYSLEKDSILLHFYKKRILRIFPTYYLIGILDCLIITHDNLPTFIFRYTTLGFWIGKEFSDWFIPSIIMLYLLSPIIKYFVDNKQFKTIILFIIAILFLSNYFTDKEYLLDRAHFFFLYRIPSFIFGMICAHWIKNNTSNRFYTYILILCLPLFAYFYPFHHQIYNYKYFSLLFLLPFFTLSFILLSKIMSFLSPILKQIGKASLEIYMIQGLFFTSILQERIIISPKWHDFTTILFMVICIFGGVITHKLIEIFRMHRLF